MRVGAETYPSQSSRRLRSRHPLAQFPHPFADIHRSRRGPHWKTRWRSSGAKALRSTMTVREYRSMNPMRNCRKNSSSTDGPATPATVTKRSGVSVAAMRKTLSSFCSTAPDGPVTRSRKAVVARDQEPARTEEKTACIDNHEDALRDAGRPGGALMSRWGLVEAVMRQACRRGRTGDIAYREEASRGPRTPVLCRTPTPASACSLNARSARGAGTSSATVDVVLQARPDGVLECP